MSTIFRVFSYNKIMEVFCNRIKELRKEFGLTQAELAKILETNNSSICDWERGRSQPDLTSLCKLACFFDVSADYLLGLEDEAGLKSKPFLFNI